MTVVASQIRGYGVWDGGVAQGGALLACWEGPAPSLLFLWVTDAQANLLQRELLAIQTSTASGEQTPLFFKSASIYISLQRDDNMIQFLKNTE